MDHKITSEIDAVQEFHKKHIQFKGNAIYGEEHVDDNMKYWNIFLTKGKAFIGIVYEDGSTVKF